MSPKSVNFLVAAFLVLGIATSIHSKSVEKGSNLARHIANGALGTRIVGGEPATENQFPYQVNVQMYGGHICGGSLISPLHVLTSATCTSIGSIENYSVRVGGLNKTDGEVIGVAEVRQHPQYDEWTYDYNIAILKLSRPVTLTKDVAIVELALEDPMAGVMATVTGWGTTSESGNPVNNQLRWVDLPIVGRRTCQEGYPNNDVTETMICAGFAEGGKGDCYGDAGGPLVLRTPIPNLFVQVGIVSWGFGCARPGVPTVYTSLANQNDYIVSNMN